MTIVHCSFEGNWFEESCYNSSYRLNDDGIGIAIKTTIFEKASWSAVRVTHHFSSIFVLFLSPQSIEGQDKLVEAEGQNKSVVAEGQERRSSS